VIVMETVMMKGDGKIDCDGECVIVKTMTRTNDNENGDGDGQAAIKAIRPM